ncbi:MAG: hypothetical protein ABIC57_01590 [bacterium]
MKIRSGFVSNSSSSSFIVATDGRTKVTFQVEVDLSSFGDVIKTEEELSAWFENEYGETWETEKYYDEERKRYDKCVEMLNAGKIIITGCVSNEGYEPEEQMLYAAGLPPAEGLEIIQDVDD